MTWTASTPAPVDGPLSGADRPILEGFLRWERTTLANVCAGLSGEQLALRPLASSKYARHNGHADLLREGIDGATGR